MKAYVTALRALAQRRLTELQLRERLERKGYDSAAIAEAIQRCKAEGFIDDRLFAQLYVEQKRKAVGNARLVAELIRKGIDAGAARAAVANGCVDEAARVEAALENVLRSRPKASYASAARALERLGFPASRIYSVLRSHAARVGPFAESPPSSYADELSGAT